MKRGANDFKLVVGRRHLKNTQLLSMFNTLKLLLVFPILLIYSTFPVRLDYHSLISSLFFIMSLLVLCRRFYRSLLGPVRKQVSLLWAWRGWIREVRIWRQHHIGKGELATRVNHICRPVDHRLSTDSHGSHIETTTCIALHGGSPSCWPTFAWHVMHVPTLLSLHQLIESRCLFPVR